MRGPRLAVLLAVAAIAVGIQNYVFFSGLPDPAPATQRVSNGPDDADVSDDGSESRDASSPGDPVEADALHPARLEAWLGSHPGVARNPFLTANEALRFDDLRSVASTGLPQLSGTLWSPGRRVALLDGRPLSEGDWIGPHRLAAIETSHVVLERDGQRVPLYVESSSPSWPVEAPGHGH